MSGRRPKYLEIKDDLARRIRAREFAPSFPLPSQAMLSKEYGVTLMTLRHALRCLEEEDMIVQRAGRGTFVSAAPGSAPVLDLRSLASVGAELEAQGIDLRTRPLQVELAALPAGTAAALDRPPAEPALRLERLRSIREAPVVHQVSWVPQPWAAQLAGIDLAQTSLYAALTEHCEVVLTSAHETLRAGSLSAARARETGVRPGRAVLLTERVTYDERRRPVVHDSATFLDDGVRLMVRRAPRRVHTSWTAPVDG